MFTIKELCKKHNMSRDDLANAIGYGDNTRPINAALVARE